MSKDIAIDVNVNRRKRVNINVNAGRKNDVDIDVDSGKNQKDGLVPTLGAPGQVLTKTISSYKWENSPIHVTTFEELPDQPTSTCLYLLEDTLKLVYWDGANWIYMNSDSELLYDDEEEMMYIQERLI